MKKLAALFLSIAVIITCSACDDNNSSNPNLDFGDPIDKHENPITYYTKEEVKEMIEQNSNLKVSDDFFYTLVPKTIDHLSEFVTCTSFDLEPKEELEEFKTIYNYLFPNHELDERCLYYYYPFDEYDDSATYEELLDQWVFGRPLNNSDILNAYLAGEYIYDGLTFLVYDEMKFPHEESVALSYRSPFGNDYCNFNKGVLEKYIAQKNGEQTYHAASSINVSYYAAECVGHYPPDSEEKFKMLDGKEISIKDAVKFFESYIESIPTAAEHSGFDIHVNDVYVYKLSEDDDYYGFDYTTSRSFDNIPFTYIDGTDVDGGNRDLASGCMVVTDDVEGAYSTYNAYRAFDEKKHTDFIPFEKAVKTISEKLTDYVDFEVTKAELFYRWGEFVGEHKIGETYTRAYPAWKLTLENPNDDITYVAYLNALTGEFSGGR